MGRGGVRVAVAVLATVGTVAGLGGVARAGGRLGPESVVTVRGTGFVDGYGREVVLRGFNVSGEAKLAENGGLPFANAADAAASATAMRRLTGANAIRFLVSWASAQPAAGQLNQ